MKNDMLEIRQVIEQNKLDLERKVNKKVSVSMFEAFSKTLDFKVKEMDIKKREMKNIIDQSRSKIQSSISFQRQRMRSNESSRFGHSSMLGTQEMFPINEDSTVILTKDQQSFADYMNF